MRLKNITNAHINRFNSGQLSIVDVLTKSTYSREFQPPEITVCLQISNKRRPYLAWSLLSEREKINVSFLSRPTVYEEQVWRKL